MPDIRVVELFAGVGGFRLGLEAASERYKTIWADQWEPSMREQHAFDCYAAHFGQGENVVCEDIKTAKTKIPAHDLLVGGFPCQDYSIAKKNSEGIEGKKGVLWWQIDDIIKEKRPPYILLENVDRILRSPAKQYGRDFSIILRCLYEKGYAAEWRVINAADYGQGQRRRRTFILAYHKNTELFRELAESVCKKWLKAMHSFVTKESVLAKAFPISGHEKIYTDSWIDEMEYAGISDVSANQRVRLYDSGVMMNARIYSVDVRPQKEAAIPLSAVREKDPVNERYFLKEADMHKWRYAKGAKNELRRKRDGSEYYFTEGSVKFPDPLDGPSRTMLTSESEVGRSSHVIEDCVTGKLRTLTPVECERLNGFPDNWTNTGMPERMRYYCMGNALVVPIVTRIGKALSEVI
ncbi:MAG: DNA (cytosine-5-)-methyltransferase [Clostridia bacterium]|nr:DNA (cytosine-5-)-methyltransferase [Clostridia bacterium]